jgi:hypothetical protein
MKIFLRIIEICKCTAWAESRHFRSLRKIANSDEMLASSCLSARLFVRLEHLSSLWTIFRKFISTFFEDLSIKFKFYSSMTRIGGTSRENFVHTYDISLNSS